MAWRNSPITSLWKRLFGGSVVLQTGLIMGCIAFMALFSMVSTVIIAETARGDAAAVNMAGSLRMQAFRIATTLLHQPAHSIEADGARVEMREFDRRLHSDTLLMSMPARATHPVREAYEQVTQRWEQEMRPRLLHYLDQQHLAAPAEFLAKVDDFSRDVDRLVGAIQRTAETRIQVLRLLQGMAIFLTVGLVFFAMHQLHSTVTLPLGELLGAVRSVQDGDLSARVAHTAGDEIGTLGDGFNTMAESLQQMQHGLEREVKRKTADLSRSNDALKLLYETARSLTPETLDADTLRTTLRHLSTITGTAPVTLRLSRNEGTQAYRTISVPDSQAPDVSAAPGTDTGGKGKISRGQGTARASGIASIPLIDRQQHHGMLYLQYPPGGLPEPWKLRLAEAVADQVASALTRSSQSREKRRLALMKERAVIARELHDSLAQSLSYLKIQVSRLQKLTRKAPANPELDSVLLELRTGLNESYRHLRELLVNFRLQMNEEGLEQALQETTEAFQKQGDISIGLNVELAGAPLDAHDEIHLLHIAREALSNIVQHARATKARLSLVQTDDGICALTVEDDGVGIPLNFEKVHHYGTRIMRERAESLGGTFHIGPSPLGGTRVQVQFTPDRAQPREDTRIS